MQSLSQVRPDHPTPPLPCVDGVVVAIHPVHTRYAIGTDGSVWSCAKRGHGTAAKRWIKLKGETDRNGYHRCSIDVDGHRCWKKFCVLVLETFVGPRPGDLLVRHLDGNPANDALENIAWGTASENQMDAVRHGTSGGFSNARLTEDQVRAIRDARNTVLQKDLAIKFGICKTTVCRIQTGKQRKRVLP